MKHLIVLTPRAAAVQLLTFLQHLNGTLRCHAIGSLSSLRSLSRQCGDAARLISFGTDILVPGDVLKRIRYGSYNFHPGPPCYPGWAPASFAIMDGALTFGATAHLMVEKIDAGPIIGTELFPVPPDITADLLAAEATRATGRLLRRLGPLLARLKEPLPRLPVGWGPHRGTRAEFARLRDQTDGLNEEELQRHRRAFLRPGVIYGQDLGAPRPASADCK